MLKLLISWIDNEATWRQQHETDPSVDWLRIIPFILLHLGVFAVFWVGYSTTALLVAFGLYYLRMFAIGGFYHRYFSHRTFKTHRITQFIFAFLGCMAIQRGPLWWAAHHREHHSHADQINDIHSPVQHGFLTSHMLWFLTKKHFFYHKERVRDLARFPELVWLDRFDIVPPVVLAVLLLVVGHLLAIYKPALGTSAWQLFVWGFVISSVAQMHTTFTINSLLHQFGSRRYPTNDHSRNNVWLAILTMGEGWHNNHHYYPSCTRQGFYWWEIDMTYYLLYLFAKTGLIWDLRAIPREERDRYKHMD